MKKIFSLLTVMTVFCMLGFAQSAPVTAKKATLMGDNAQVKDVKTGQVLRTAKASKQIPYTYSVASGLKNGAQPVNNTATPTNSNVSKKSAQKVTLQAVPTLKTLETKKQPVNTTTTNSKVIPANSKKSAQTVTLQTAPTMKTLEMKKQPNTTPTNSNVPKKTAQKATLQTVPTLKETKIKNK